MRPAPFLGVTRDFNVALAIESQHAITHDSSFGRPEFLETAQFSTLVDGGRKHVEKEQSPDTFHIRTMLLENLHNNKGPKRPDGALFPLLRSSSTRNPGVQHIPREPIHKLCSTCHGLRCSRLSHNLGVDSPTPSQITHFVVLRGRKQVAHNNTGMN